MTTSEDYASQYADLLKQLTEGVTAQQTAYTGELNKQKDIDIGNLRGLYEQSGLANAGQMFKTIGTEIQPEYAGKAAAHYADLTQQALEARLQGTGNLVNMQQQQEQINYNKQKDVVSLTQDLINEQGYSYAEAWNLAKTSLGYQGEDIPNPNPTTGTESSGPNIASQTGQTLLSLITSAPGEDTLKSLESNPLYSRFMELPVVKETFNNVRKDFKVKKLATNYATLKVGYTDLARSKDLDLVKAYGKATGKNTMLGMTHYAQAIDWKIKQLEEYNSKMDALELEIIDNGGAI